MITNPLGILKRSPIGSLEIEKRIHKLCNTIRYYDLMRRVFKEPQCSDEEHLALRLELGKLASDYPDEAKAIPKARSIAEQLTTFGQIARHDYPVLDLRPIHDLGGLKRWMEMVDSDGDIIMTPVYAGAVVELIYVGGHLHKAVTKGCGIEGHDVTAQAYLVDGVPQEINIDSRISIRGTVTLPTPECQIPIERAATRALMAFRNESTEIKHYQQHLKFIPDEINIPENTFSTTELRFILLEWGFYIERSGTINARRRETGYLDELVGEFDRRVSQSELPVIGIRFVVDSALRKMELGYTSRYAEWAISLVKGEPHAPG